MKFYYVYLIQSEIDPSHFYVGFSEDLTARLKDHNAGKFPNTARYRPWRISTAHAFTAKTKALAFEKYLKSGSGREFARRHF